MNELELNELAEEIADKAADGNDLITTSHAEIVETAFEALRRVATTTAIRTWEEAADLLDKDYSTFASDKPIRIDARSLFLGFAAALKTGRE